MARPRSYRLGAGRPAPLTAFRQGALSGMHGAFDEPRREAECLSPMTLDEGLLLEVLDGILRSQAIRVQIDPIVERVQRKLASAVMAWEPIPLSVYGETLPTAIRSSWVFIL